jgi:Predicted membrane protein
MVEYLLWTAVCFFSGSVMYSYLIPKVFYKKDITKISKDGNPGCGNVFTCVGVPCGIICLLLELAKGAVPVWLALRYVNPDNIMFAGVLAAPVLGHAFSPMLKNHGGKAIAVTFGSYIGLCPHSMILFLLAIPFVFFSTVLRITPHSLRVMLTYLVTLISALFFENKFSVLLAAVIITAAVIYRHIGDYIHRENCRYGVYIFFIRILGKEKDDRKAAPTAKS